MRIAQDDSAGGPARRTPVSTPVPGSAAASAPARVRKRSRRAIFLTWLRKTHLYVGLWGAALGLLFGATGILMNHRAILKIPVEKTVQTSFRLPLADGAAASPQAMSGWLQRELGLGDTPFAQARTQPAAAVVWEGQERMQPERWNIVLQHPRRGVSAEYYVGNRFVKVERLDATPIGTLTRLHMAVGVSAFWVLLSDTIAGSLILLSLTGLLLWTQLHTVRVAAVAAASGALLAAAWLLWAM